MGPLSEYHALMILPILTDFNVPGTLLRQKAEPVTVFDQPTRQLVQDLIDTLYDSPTGIGLAANQVGALSRVMVIDLDRKAGKGRNLRVFINPVLRKGSGHRIMEEGCLSLPGQMTKPQRYGRIEVEAHDVEGRPFRLRADGLMATCIQHEMDHLDGIIMTVRAKMPPLE